MTGKVFQESSNIFQDQAKVLFDYYKAAAESIVIAEMNEERNKEDLINQKNITISQRGKYKITFIVSFVLGALFFLMVLILMSSLAILGVVGLIGGIVAGVLFLIKYIQAGKEIENYDNLIIQSDQKYQNIRRDFKVDKIGVVYVPVATRVPFENRSFLLDHTGEVRDTDFNLNVLHQPEEFQDSVQKLTQSMDTLPIVEKNVDIEEVNTAEYSTSIQNITLNDYVGNVDRQVRNISYLLGDSDDVSVKIPVIKPTSVEANNLREYGTNETNGHPVVTAYDVSFEDRLDKFSSLNALKDQLKASDDTDSNDYMKHLMQDLAESVQIFTKTKNSSTSKMIAYTSSIFDTVLKSGYTQYSPALEAEEIERIRTTDFNFQTAVNDYTPFSLKKSSMVKYDMFSNNWVAEDGSRTSMPFGMHQIDEEIFMPVIASLMNENRIERLRIYNNIEDQKREYLERWSSETGNYFRDNRKSADELITHMRETYSEYMSAYNMYMSLSETSGSMKSSGKIEDSEVKELDMQADMIAGFEAQALECNQKQEQFADFMDRIQESISDSTQEFSHIEYYEGSLRDSLPHETAVSMDCIHDLDNRRRNLLGISPYVANCAELPPEPHTSEKMQEDISIDLVQQAETEVQHASDVFDQVLGEQGV
ncbi:MAG: hypothetical protein K6G45_09885 [Lachnospiraceae bacterium]|nr:hypothetical protein [Lachnospiraceae bacterium]